jgi:hypothetical protein
MSKKGPWQDRFWIKVDKNGPVPEHRPDLGPCWIWTAYIDPNGYGRFQLDGAQYSHVVAYESEVKKIDPGSEIDHLCRTRACCRPSHLEDVPHQINALRGNGWAGRAWRGEITDAMRVSRASQQGRHAATCKRGHPRTPKHVYVTPAGQWMCRTCAREIRRLRRELKKAILPPAS